MTVSLVWDLLGLVFFNGTGQIHGWNDGKDRWWNTSSYADLYA
jgi:hypothetical protein